MPHVERIDLAGAGSVTITLDDRGAILTAVDAAAPWRTRSRFPSGPIARRRPADGVGVVLEHPETGAHREVELGLLPDRTWELTVAEGWSTQRVDAVDTPAGRVTCSLRDGEIRQVVAEARPGWRADRQVRDNEATVVFTRGTEEWEIMLDADGEPGEPVQVEREHRRRLAPS